MTFNPAVPLNSDSPAIFPAQNQQNMARLQTLLGADHQFNLSSTANDGYHNLIHLTQQAPSGVLAATGREYVKSSSGRINLFYMDDQGTEYQITPSMPIRAAVNFDGTGGVDVNQTIRSQYNVASVFKTATGQFKISFTTPMPDINYIVLFSGMRPQTNRQSNPSVTGDSTYGNSFNVNYVLVSFWGSSSDLQDPLMGGITIMSVT